MKTIASMNDTELMNLVFERVGMYVGPDATGLAHHATHDGRIIAGAFGSKQQARYYALCYLAAHALSPNDTLDTARSGMSPEGNGVREDE